VEAEIAALWAETARLQRRFASSPVTGEGRDPAPRVARPGEPPRVDPMPIEDERSPRRRNADTGNWRVAVVGSILIAAAILAADRAGLLDPAREWLHLQIERLSAPTGNESTAQAPVSDSRREPVTPTD
jgi:hypothetical protein